jgi:amino acid transporter
LNNNVVVVVVVVVVIIIIIIIIIIINNMNLVLGYGPDDRSSRVLFPAESGNFFSSPPRPERLWGPPSLLRNGYQGLSLGVKRPGRESNHSPPSSAEVKE